MDKDPFSNYRPNLFPRAKRAAEWLLGSISMLPNEPLASHGDHFTDHQIGHAVIVGEMSIEEAFRKQANEIIN